MRRIKTLFFIVVERAQRSALAIPIQLSVTPHIMPFISPLLYEQLVRWYNAAYDSFCMCFDLQRAEKWRRGNKFAFQRQHFVADVMARAIKKSSTLPYLKWKPNVKRMISCAKIHLAIKNFHRTRGSEKKAWKFAKGNFEYAQLKKKMLLKHFVNTI